MLLVFRVLFISLIMFAGFPASGQPPAKKPTLGFLGFKCLGIDTKTQKSIEDLVESEFVNYGKYSIVKSADFKARLKNPPEKIFRDCGKDAACYASAARDAGTDTIAVGTIAGLGKSRTIGLKLIDAAEKILLNEVSRAVVGPEKELISVIPKVALDLLDNVNSLEIKVNLDGAIVYLDGRGLGASPVSAQKNIRVGKHSLKVEKPGYTEYEDFFEIGFGVKKDLSVEIRPTSGFLKLACDADAAKVNVDGKETAITPVDKPLILSPGKHLIEIIKPYHATFKAEVVMELGKTADLKASLPKQKGLLKVDTIPPGADVKLDSNPAGKTPIESTVDAGRHEICISKGGFKELKKEIIVDPQTGARLSIGLEALAFASAGEEAEMGKGPWYKKWWLWVITGAVVSATVGVVAFSGGEKGGPPGSNTGTIQLP